MSHTNINSVVLVGRLTHDPELRALPSGETVCNLRLACNTPRKGADGEYTQKANFFNVEVFGAAGESVHRYQSKGSRLAIAGRLEWREWETPEGTKRQTVEIVARNVEFLDSRGDRDDLEGSPDGAHDADGTAAEHELVGVGSGIEDDIVF